MEAVIRRTGNAKGKRKGQAIINKILNRKLKIAQHELMCFEKVSSLCHHLAEPHLVTARRLSRLTTDTRRHLQA